jgi:hypothetical protein
VPDAVPDTGPTGPVALVCNGIGTVFNVPRTIGDDFTMEAWIRPSINLDTGTQFFDGAGLLYADVSGVHNDFGSSLLGGSPAFGTGNPDTTIVAPAPLALSVWTHVAFVRKKANDLMRIVVNGTTVAMGMASNHGTLNSSTSISVCGNTIDGRYYAGRIRAVSFWTIQRSDAQIQADMNTALTGTETGLVGYWPLDEGTGSVAHDLSPMANNASIANPGWAAGP